MAPLKLEVAKQEDFKQIAKSIVMNFPNPLTKNLGLILSH